MRRTRIKVCGMIHPNQVAAAVAMGVDAIGMIFYEESPRCVTIEQAKAVRKIVPAFVSLVGVFVNENTEAINAISTEVSLDMIQLHGDETDGDAKPLIKPYLRAIRVKNQDYVTAQIAEHKHASGYLLDSYSNTLYGGTGKLFDNSLLPKRLPNHLIYAGGISSSNIDEFLIYKPFAIDVNSGIEKSPGDKDIDALRCLVEMIRKRDIESSKIVGLK